ncbi:sensor histidine kinase [Bacillus rubiinfantis]|uniref:sensor histidine kinase n=1 Tax=Bacillus rubiinfantis TaxID=1499680 RepID=UPI0005A69792|nr:sensor histidine kinase [Bacillus rubiinfantis]
MRIMPHRFKYNGFFTIMFLITVIIIIIVSLSITWTTIRMSEKFFIEKFSITNSKVINQIKESFESFHYSVVGASNNLLQSKTVRNNLTAMDKTNEEKMSSIFNMYQQMKNIKANLEPYNAGILVMGKNGVSYSSDRSYWPVDDEQLKVNVVNQPKKLIYQYYQLPQENRLEQRNFIVASKAIMDRISGKVYGSLYISIAENDLRNFYSNYTSAGNNVFLIDKTGRIVSSNKEKMIGTIAKDLLGMANQLENSSKEYLIDSFMGREQIFLMEYLPSLDMYLINVIDKQTAIGNVIDKKAITLISMGIVMIALVIVFIVSRRLTKSLTNLVRQISDVSKADFHQYVTVAGSYETQQIGKAFNSMLDELHDYVNKLVKAQKEQRNAELAALQQQINPHFLYNTLTTIKFMVQMGDKDETEATINALISLLQNTIGNVDETITVQQEIDNLKNYVFINQKRYGNRIKVNYFITPDCLNCKIPKLILQPFIENAFFHGFNVKQEGYINILVWREDSILLCEVIDNGDGMENNDAGEFPKTRRNRKLFSGIGIKNVHERIQLIYGNSYGLNISSKLGEGTKVKITIPITEN